MAQLIVRNIDDEIVRELKMRAARNGRSAEAEHREILKQVLQPDSMALDLDLKQLLMSVPDVGEDEDFARVQDLGRDALL